jgi:hypothetical protein
MADEQGSGSDASDEDAVKSVESGRTLARRRTQLAALRLWLDGKIYNRE